MSTVKITLTNGDTREVHPDTPVRLAGGYAPFLAKYVKAGETCDAVYEPTRDHWTPYEPWMRDVLADDARVSWMAGGLWESRGVWGEMLPHSAVLGSPVGHGLRIHPDAVPERPAEDDPDEALAVVIEELVDDHGGTSEWADNEYITRSTALAIARAAREHIEAEREEGGYNIRRAERECKRLTNRADLWRERCQKAEADAEHWRAEFNQADRRIVGLTAERDKWQGRAGKAEADRDEWQARHEALRSDVEEMRHDFDRGLWPDFKGVLARDTERGEQG